MQRIFHNVKTICVVVLLVEIVIASYRPLDLPSYLLHQVGTVLFLLALYVCNRREPLSAVAWIGSTLFLSLHILAAHYLYSFVPYNDWLKSWFGLDLNATLGFGRNMFDRLVHFGYGFLLFPVFAEGIRRWSLPLQSHWKWGAMCVMWIMASSMVYELIEWAISLLLSPEAVENYNGQQGDVWDAHKDMLLATFGGLAAWIMMPNSWWSHFR
ncbi:DUF2238 domain-containing protein [Snodgrassella sp. CFCC 13594]|jgi:putative membrane protein|uniref:DUF2238 domain-containing protein n=1 Tax=Snodgrassella sp. CFCC 13594 TaxID=1775559 RepID=UPI000834A281|nr:DUF2238 domain-containing protein [Snodgrassella sp. CFCC 13594]